MEEPSLERETEREDSLQVMKQRLKGFLNSSASYKPIVSASPSQPVLHVLGNKAHLGQYYFNQRKELRSQTTPRKLPLFLPSYELSRGQRTRHSSFLISPARLPLQWIFLRTQSNFHTWNLCSYCYLKWFPSSLLLGSVLTLQALLTSHLVMEMPLPASYTHTTTRYHRDLLGPRIPLLPSPPNTLY